MKSDRLLSILLLLQTRGRVSAGELAERLEVSPRTIYRDVESLSAAGVPVYAERGRHGGIALLPGFRTDVTGLTTDEARALFVLAAQGAHSALGLEGALGSALRKVMAALPAPHRPVAELTSRRILVDPDRWMTPPRPAVDLDVLHTAVFTDRRLRVRYRHGGDTRVRRYTVDPYGLVSKGGTWYLVADRDGVPRLFRADRVVAATVTDAPVRRRAGVDLAEVWQALRREVEERPAAVRVRVRVRRSRWDMFLRIVGALLVEPPVTGPSAPDGRGWDQGDQGDAADPGEEWVTAEVGYPVLAAVCHLLQFGPDVEVVEPPEARRRLAEAAASVLALYADGPGGSDG
ncbi:helix-turn-helix transcriptional regulator [Allostreptomyces psammosilenae]|uniref:Putative DNA-binding transcriptional regulator YafY n=1 Tax=Allostreptomyces psammosilenae TaxID=1892865 RepID=A0A853A4P3_9ACTN|nr:YafY family protein [Allostreptomyces psammosilenae]NYI05472.1 putative DNA-binding transcriptional regulator YafY [Allostreptomyces psammosilenae]